MKFLKLASATITILLSTTVIMPTAIATPVAYNIDLTVTGGSTLAFDGVTIGQVFSATVDLDDQAIGDWYLPSTGSASNFYLDLNGTIFDTSTNSPVSPSDHGANLIGTDPSPFSPTDSSGWMDYILRINWHNAPINSTISGLVISGIDNIDTTWRAWDSITQQQISGTFTIEAVPVPAAVWLFGSGLIGLVGFAKRKKA